MAFITRYDHKDDHNAGQRTEPAGKSLDFCVALGDARGPLTADCCAASLTPSTATPSEVASANGGLTPRLASAAEDDEAPSYSRTVHYGSIAETRRGQDELDDSDDDDDKPGGMSGPSKSARRRLRRRRQREALRAAEDYPQAEPVLEPYQKFFYSPPAPPQEQQRVRQRTTVTLDDLGLNLTPSRDAKVETPHAPAQGCIYVDDVASHSTIASAAPWRTAAPAANGADWLLPASPCRPNNGIMSTAPCESPVGVQARTHMDAATRAYVPMANLEGSLSMPMLDASSRTPAYYGTSHHSMPAFATAPAYYPNEDVHAAVPFLQPGAFTGEHMLMTPHEVLPEVVPMSPTAALQPAAHLSAVNEFAAHPARHETPIMPLSPVQGQCSDDMLRLLFETVGSPHRVSKGKDLLAELRAVAPDVYED